MLSMHLGERFAQLRKERGKTVEEAAAAMGISKQAVYQFETGQTKGLKPENLVAAARLVGVSAEELVSGHRVGEPLGIYNIKERELTLHPWHVVSWVNAGSRSEAVEPYEPGAAPTVDFETAPTRGDYALQVRNDSMVRPDGSGFPDGCYIAIQHARRAKSGDFVVVRFRDTDEATFKQLIIDGPVKIMKPLNPNYKPFMLPPDAVIVGVVCEKRLTEKF